MDQRDQYSKEKARRKRTRQRPRNSLIRMFLSLSLATQLMLGSIGLMLLLVGWLFIAAMFDSGSTEVGKKEYFSAPKSVEAEPKMPTGVAATKVYQSLAGVHVSTDNVRRQFNRLQNVIVSLVRTPDRSIDTDDFLAESFVGFGIDRKRFAPRLSDSQIKVLRWRHGDSAPRFSGDAVALVETIRSAYQPWLKSNDFRIDLSLYSFDEGQNRIFATVVASGFGRVGHNEGRQATSLWKTTWSRPQSSDSLPTLESLKMVAQEEIGTRFKGGRLLRDCTGSILKRCWCLPDQLAYGTDQWARRIPGIDLKGEHGVAVGDVNGDGLEDLFVCQPHGLPNLLLVQNLDGTCEDLSHQAKVDVLDSSYAALIIDIDNDRDQDLVVSTDECLLLFSNKGDGTFQIEHRMLEGRSARHICAADYDQDGDLDLFLCKFEGVRKRDDLIILPRDLSKSNDGGRNVLLRNDEGWRFTDATQEVGMASNNRYFTRSAVWADCDQDGDQDLYITNAYASDQLYENQHGWFKDVTETSGISRVAHHRTVSCGDFNHDGKTDFYVATDVPFSVERSYGMVDRDSTPRDLRDALTGDSQIWYGESKTDLWRRFAMRAPLFSCQSAFSSAPVDLNNDGLEDILVTNGMLSRYSTNEVDDMLYRRLFSGTNEEVNFQISVAAQSEAPPSPQVAKIIRETTDMCRVGYSFAGHQRDRCFLSIGALGFANFSGSSGADLLHDGRAIATTDWDDDGDCDVIMTSRNGCRLKILLNQLGSENDFLQLTLTGTKSNRDAIGARTLVFLAGKEKPIVRTVSAGSGYLSQSSKRLTLGLGPDAIIDRVTVVWPNGERQTHDDIQPNFAYRVIEGQDKVSQLSSQRVELNLTESIITGRVDLPDANACLFHPPSPVPELEFINTAGEVRAALAVSPKTPTLLVVVDDGPQSRSLINSISDGADQWKEQAVGCVAIVTDGTEVDSEPNLSTGQKLMEQIQFPFRWGGSTKDSKERIALWHGNFFGAHQVPRLPFGILFDTDRNAVSYYAADQINRADLLHDAGRLAADTRIRWDRAMPLSGRWFAPYRHPETNRLTMRLAELGHHWAAKQLHETAGAYRAYEYCCQGLEFLSSGSTTLAKRFFRKAVDADPQSPLARLAIAQVLRDEALQLVGDDAGTVSQRMELREKAISSFNHAIKLDPKNTDAIIGRANIAIDTGDISEAIRILQEYVKLQPDNHEISAIIGRLLFQRGKPQEASQWLAEAFDHRPTLPFVSGDLGFLYLSVGKHREAVPFLELANRLQPSDQNVHRLLAEAYYLSGKYADSIAMCEDVFRRNPNRQRPAYVLAWLLVTAPQEYLRDAERAIEVMTPAMKIHAGKSASTNEIYAAIMAERGDFEKAIRYQQKASVLVLASKSTEQYSAAQRRGMSDRLRLYEQGKLYRMGKPTETPLGVPGLDESE